MPAFRVSGATGQAPTTSFFDGIDGRFTMLAPMHPNGDNLFQDMMINADNINLWTIYNTSFDSGPNATTVSLGAMTTAPDGTNTAQKVVETTTNSVHKLTAGSNAELRFNGSGQYPLRLTVFAKGAERTRIVLYATNQYIARGAGSGAFGVHTVFDLAGGQIGVTGTSIGTPASWLPISQEIKPYGSGWYKCSMDFSPGSFSLDSATTTWILAGFYLDNGSGTAAESSSYTGDGTSGVFTWRCSMMPPGASGIRNQVFFDDFTSLATIDINNTLAPGFNWYTNNNWPCYGFQTAQIGPAIPSNQITQSGSVMTFGPDGGNPGLMTVGWTGGSTYVGQVWQAPFLFEASVAISPPSQPVPVSSAFWSFCVEGLLNMDPGTPPTAFISPSLMEIDIYENNNGWQNSEWALFVSWGHRLQDDVQPISIQTSFVGYPLWYSTPQYGGANVVYWNGNFYSALDASINKQPDISPSDWGPFTPAANQPLIANTTHYDAAQQHVYSCLLLPYSKQAGFGYCMRFFDGIWIQRGIQAYRPDPLVASVAGNSSSFQFVTDYCHMPLFLGTSNSFAIGTDWVRVTQ